MVVEFCIFCLEVRDFVGVNIVICYLCLRKDVEDNGPEFFRDFGTGLFGGRAI